MANKLSIFPTKRRELGREAAQREWLERNNVTVIDESHAWKWPQSTWMQLRLDKLRAERPRD